MIELEDAFLKVRNRTEMDAFFQAVFTQRELARFQKRWRALCLSIAGETQRTVKMKLKAGVATATRAAKTVREEGNVVRAVLNRERSRKRQ